MSTNNVIVSETNYNVTVDESNNLTVEIALPSVGPSGPVGYTGSAGPQGVKGYDGSVGYTGSIGFTGSAGATGDVGYVGSVGQTGYAGSKGDVGYAGSVGVQGYTGSIGAPTSFRFLIDHTSQDTTSDTVPVGYLRFNYSGGHDATEISFASQDAEGNFFTSYASGLVNWIYDINNQFDLILTNKQGQTAVWLADHFNVQNRASGGLTYIYLSPYGSSSVYWLETATEVFIDIGWSTKGAIGYTGSTGAGYVGSRGETGYVGSKGADGIIGYNGSIGYTGSAGIQGYTGSKGEDGIIGYNGSIGYTGSAGADSTIPGPQGIQGPIGYTGSSGTGGGGSSVTVSETPPATPLNGDMWWNSADGQLKVRYEDTDSAQWVDAINGIVGPTGYVGSQGIQGFTGSQGDIGYTGSRGVEGYVGSQGIQGYTGSQGIQGVQGLQGYTGSQGEIGYTGSASTVIGYTGSKGQDGAVVLDDLNDVTIATPTAAQILGYNGSQWINTAAPQGAPGYLYSGTITTQPQGTGEDSIVIGDGCTTSQGTSSVVIGKSSSASAQAGYGDNIAIGRSNTMSGSNVSDSIALGRSNTGGSVSVVMGNNNTLGLNVFGNIILGANCSIPGTNVQNAGGYCNILGSQHTISSVWAGGYANTIGYGNSLDPGSVALGTFAHAATGGFTYAQGRFAATGDAQVTNYVQRLQTTDATPTILRVSTGAHSDITTTSPGASISVLANTTMLLEYSIVARKSPTGTDYAAWNVSMLVSRESGSIASIVGTPVITQIAATAGASTWAITPNVTNSSITLTVTGQAATQIRWVANVIATKCSN